MHLSRLRRWFLASPPIEFAISNLKELLVGALRQGPIPQHVAFVMDGNRRFARSHGIETVEGHNLGFEALARVCRSLVQHVGELSPVQPSLRRWYFLT
jgi:ditrans,polycis-polyprenyl diphosphate synthase